MKINGHQLPDKANILGTEYKIIYDNEDNDPRMKKGDGYCEFYAKEIHIDKSVFEQNNDDPFQMKNLDIYGLKVIRHEVIHAFILESGLWECCEWAQSEELTDWIARQFPKIQDCFEDMGVDK